MDKEAPITKPNYMHSFRCIGDKCEDTCCAGWRVVFDKRTTQAYMTSDDPEIKSIAQSKIKKIKKDRSSTNYSFVQMNVKGACPFQQTDKFCMIQNRMGEKALSKTCSTYPRHQGVLDQGQVEVATLSCPEAARLCLLHKDAMHIDGHKDELFFTLTQPEKSDKQSALAFLHSSALDLLGDQRIRSEEFILIYSTALSILIKNSEDSFSQDTRFVDFSTIVRLVRQSLSEVRSSELKNDPGVRFQISRVMPLLVKRTREQLFNNQRFAACSIRCLQGLAVSDGDTETSARLYAEALNSLTVSEKETLTLGLRNYLLNDLIKNSGQYRGTAVNAFAALQSATVRLCIVTFLILGAKAVDDELVTKDLLVEAVSSSSRAFEHNATLVDQISAVLNNIEAQSPAMLGLIAPKV
jgi:lysine-N-methylase